MIREVRGMLEFGPSPCLETPCLPGTAFLIREGSCLWLLRHDGRLLDWGDEAGGVNLVEGMHVKLAGTEAVLKDMYGTEHPVMELIRIEKL